MELHTALRLALMRSSSKGDPRAAAARVMFIRSCKGMN